MSRRRTGTRHQRRVREPLLRCAATGKVRHRDLLEAKLVLARKQRQGSGNRPKTERRAYRCPHCHYWHLTSAA